jgi:hypothetical protein
VGIPQGSSFGFPLDVALAGNGNLFVVDHGDCAVEEILAAGGYVTVNTAGDNPRHFNQPTSVWNPPSARSTVRECRCWTD